MIRLDIHVEKESRKLLQVFENNPESCLIFNRHFLSLSKDFVFLFLVDFSHGARAINIYSNCRMYSGCCCPRYPNCCLWHLSFYGLFRCNIYGFSAACLSLIYPCIHSKQSSCKARHTPFSYMTGQSVNGMSHFEAGWLFWTGIQKAWYIISPFTCCIL